ncbi:hypothetical protein L3Q72_15430 [Vibrio sp. JC009]|uniref:hypothetical protein n=1 Tax=Vibrio sp. JC009 TaxID=2912314 RepID=UPI0023B01801|nr:hypothetical protein [Vibrio sp. JC009]WED24273.1 hypothetical protein L3Q72_15430 [Vibrio sp. JC009]
MERHQIKEALDKIAYMTPYDPRKSIVTSARPNDIRITYTGEKGLERDFRYSDGELLVWSAGVQVWVPADSV